MTPPHTPESLLALKESPEGLEQLRIIAAELDGWTQIAFRKHPDSNKICNDEPDALWFGVNPEKTGVRKLAEYTTSLDAIFAAEERLGLHNEANRKLRAFWYVNASKYFDPVWADAAQRTAIFIPTAQWKAQNP